MSCADLFCLTRVLLSVLDILTIVFFVILSLLSFCKILLFAPFFNQNHTLLIFYLIDRTKMRQGGDE